MDELKELVRKLHLELLHADDDGLSPKATVLKNLAADALSSARSFLELMDIEQAAALASRRR